MMKKTVIVLTVMSMICIMPASVLRAQETEHTVSEPKLKPKLFSVWSGGWGYINEEGYAVISAQFSIAKEFSEGLAAVHVLKEAREISKFGKWGFIDKTGTAVILPDTYDFVRSFSGGLAAVEKDAHGLYRQGKWGFIDRTGAEIIPFNYDGALSFSCGLAAVNVGGRHQFTTYDYSIGIYRVLGGKWGFVDRTGVEVIPLKYDEVRPFVEDMAAVRLKNKWGFIDKTGTEVTPFKYDEVKDFSKGMAAVKITTRQSNIETEKWGFVNKTGDEVVPCKYDNAESFVEDITPVYHGTNNNKWAFIDKTNRMVTPFMYEEVRNFESGLAVVKAGDKYGFINTAGATVVPCKYSRIRINAEYDEGIRYVNKTLKYTGLMSRSMVTGGVTQSEIISERVFSDGLAIVGAGVEQHVRWALIDTTGAELTPFKYEEMEMLTNGAGFMVKFFNKWGIIDRSGKEVIPCKYEELEVFPRKGMFKIRLNGKCGMVDMIGKEIIQPLYKDIWIFARDIIGVESKGKWGLVNSAGVEVVPCKYDNKVKFTPDGLVKVCANKKWGFIDETGAEIIPCIYQKVSDFIEGKAAVQLEKRKFFIDKTGNEIK
jgi:hypothetical protein